MTVKCDKSSDIFTSLPESVNLVISFIIEIEKDEENHLNSDSAISIVENRRPYSSNSSGKKATACERERTLTTTTTKTVQYLFKLVENYCRELHTTLKTTI